jgi:hypothetical protein
MIELLIVLGGSGGLLILLVWTLAAWLHRRRFMRRVERHACAVCATPFTEAIADYAGAVTRADRAGLDNFQKRFAAYKIICRECESENICTAEGEPFRGRVIRADR